MPAIPAVHALFLLLAVAGNLLWGASMGSMPFLVEIANGSMGSRHLFEAAFQVRLQRSA